MELSNADLNFLEMLVKRIDVLCSISPKGTSNKHYNTWRLLVRQDLPKLKRKIDKWKTMKK